MEIRILVFFFFREKNVLPYLVIFPVNSEILTTLWM